MRTFALRVWTDRQAFSRIHVLMKQSEKIYQGKHFLITQKDTSTCICDLWKAIQDMRIYSSFIYGMGNKEKT